MQCCGGNQFPRNFQIPLAISFFPTHHPPIHQRVHRIPMLDDLDHRSHTSSISVWLNGHPDIPEQYSECDVSLADAPGNKRKRHPQSQQQPRLFPRRSRCLIEISGNAMSRKSPRKSPTKDSVHQSKVSRLQKNALDPVQEQLHHARSAPVLTASRITHQEPDDRAIYTLLTVPVMVRLRPSSLRQQSPPSQPPLLRAATPPHPHGPVALVAQRSA